MKKRSLVNGLIIIIALVIIASCGKKGNECKTNADCPSGEICIAGSCESPEKCSKDSDCESGYVCLNNICIPKEAGKCNTDSDCPVSYVCQDGTCVSLKGTTPPETTLISYPRNPTNSTSATFEFTCDEGSCTFECKLDNGAYSSCSSPKTYTNLSEGLHIFYVRAKDSAGTTDPTPASYSWTIDITPPETTITSQPPNPSNSTLSVFEFTCNEEPCTFECQLDSGGWSFCESPKIYTGLSDGSHTFEVRAIDSAGNVDRTPATSSWTIDSIPPETTITSYPQNPTNSTSATFEFTCDEGNCVFECKLDNGAYSSCSSPKTFINLSEGLHIFYVRTKDSAGNTDPTPAIYSWTIDITPPETTITSQPPNPSNSTLSVFEFTCNEEPCTFECHLDNGGWLSCTSPKIYSGLSDGSHTFEVRAIDSAGNIDKTPATYSWTIDSIPPETTITSCPQNPTNSTSATFEFICNEESCTFECKIDNGFWESCASPNTFTNLSEGSHTFYVRAKDSAGNTDPTPASYSWTIDITPPETTITSQPPNPSNSSNATFGFVCNEPSCTFECQLDGGGWTLCISPKTYTGLFDGTHVFEVKAIDAGGNVDPTPATYSWAITLPPTLLWSYMTGNQVDGHPSLGDIDNDGKIEVVVGSVDYKIYAINGENGSLLWSYKTGGAVYSSPSLGDIDNDGKLEVVVGSLDYKIYALNGEDGSLLWSYGTGNYVFSVPSFGDIDNDGKLEVVVGSNDDKIYAINGENGSLLWSYTTGGDVHSSPSLGDIDNDGKLEVVVGSSDYKIYALNGEDGSLLWSWTTGGMVISSPSLGDIDNDGKLEVVVGSWDYKLYALNGENGSLLWSYTAGNGVDSNPSLGDIDNDGKLEVVVGCRDSKVYALNGENGSLLWSYITGSSNTSSPSLGDINNDGKLEVIIGSFDNKIYALNGDDGSLLWTYTTGNEIHSAPAIGDIDNDGKLEVVVGSYDYKIYAISTNSPVPSPSLLPWPEFGNRGYNRTRNLDSWEINDSILTPANIIDLVRNGAIPGYIWKSGDVDFYSFPVTQAPSTIKLELKDIPSGTNYDLYLYDTNKNLVSSSTNSGNSPEAITYSTTVPGTYYIKVDSSYGYSPTKPYSLYIKIEK